MTINYTSEKKGGGDRLCSTFFHLAVSLLKSAFAFAGFLFFKITGSPLICSVGTCNKAFQ